MLKRSLLILEYIMGLLMLFITILVFSPIILRSIFNYSLVWSDEVALLAMIWLVYLGVATCYLKREHIVIDIVYNLMSPFLKWLVNLCTEILMFMLFLFLIYNSYSLTLSSWKQVLPASGISSALLILPLFIGSIIMAMYIIRNIIKIVTGKSSSDNENDEFKQIN